MARKRFSDLERVYDALKLGNVQISSLPQKLDFVQYAKWREGNGPERTIVRPNLNGALSDRKMNQAETQGIGTSLNLR
ncbi:MAG: hypothetical protein EWV91_07300 [Microcystis aeruginosa Ma_QC_Ca_00000000_S207]|uniref:Uncharacterized protein n=1 Tax=Microcystis aeruginosa Ma_QC_Ca_00000000_S207 TaxID=2486251 RepID=A0A552FSL5_MICAE|nr:MAG: hypothetical protein EWV91_07300 [Microcystis aeruginosa Ma_QC_Ca_00000000_S207]